MTSAKAFKWVLIFHSPAGNHGRKDFHRGRDPAAYEPLDSGREIKSLLVKYKSTTSRRGFLADNPNSCVTRYMYPLLLISSVVTIADQHIKNPSKLKMGLEGVIPI